MTLVSVFVIAAVLFFVLFTPSLNLLYKLLRLN